MAPLNYVRVKATIEDRSGGKVVLVDEGGEWTSGLAQPDVRTSWIVWKDLRLGPGAYEVVLVTAGGCRASARLEVHGPEGVSNDSNRVSQASNTQLARP